MNKNQVSENLAKKITSFYSKDGTLSDDNIKQLIKDINFSINRYYEPNEDDVKIYRELFDLNSDGQICQDDLKRTFLKYLI